MNKRRFSIMLLCLAGACAHGKSSSEQSAKANEPQRVASNSDDAESADRGEIAERDDERVEVPDQAQGRGRMASAGSEIPAQDKPEANTPGSAQSYGTQADNTRVNERDREGSALTPMDQGENEDDRELTQRIRKAVIGEDSLSFTAKNVKIITRDGQVTLRGSVKSQNERTTIERLAQQAAGPGRVSNQLEVAD